MNAVLVICCVVLVFCVLMLIRNEIVCNNSKKAALIVYGFCSHIITNATDSAGLANATKLSDSAWDLLDSYPEYSHMLFDFRSWRFENFYPGLEDYLDELHGYAWMEEKN